MVWFYCCCCAKFRCGFLRLPAFVAQTQAQCSLPLLFLAVALLLLCCRSELFFDLIFATAISRLGTALRRGVLCCFLPCSRVHNELQAVCLSRQPPRPTKRPTSCVAISRSQNVSFRCALLFSICFLIVTRFRSCSHFHAQTSCFSWSSSPFGTRTRTTATVFTRMTCAFRYTTLHT